MKIVKVRKGSKHRVDIILDDGQIISLAYEIFLRNNLKSNKEISESFLSKILKEDKLYQIKQLALKYLSLRAHSKNELRIKLRQKTFETELINIILDELEREKFIDDASFAQHFAEEKIKSSRWGKNKIKAELMKRGVSSQIISNVISENFGEDSEIEAGLELAMKKYKNLASRKLDQKKILNSIYSFLLSRGYDYDACKQIIMRLFDGDELEDF